MSAHIAAIRQGRSRSGAGDVNVLPLFNAARWRAAGVKLGKRERDAVSLMWDIGDWWNEGESYGERVAVVTADDWAGPKHGTCRVAGTVAGRWNVLLRHNTLSFEHHRIVAALPDETATSLLQWCLQAPEPRSTRELAARVKQVQRDNREAELADKIEKVSHEIGHQLFGVIYADPPWRFEPYSRETGMAKAADNHYPTMSKDELAALELSAADDCVLFCWATVPMLPAGMAFLTDHGFTYRTAFFWLKPGMGHGYWSARDQIEVLLVGVRGEIPAPAQGAQPAQTIIAERGPHSEKPEAFAAMIETMFPHLPRLEMFARRERAGWETWGAEL